MGKARSADPTIKADWLSRNSRPQSEWKTPAVIFPELIEDVVEAVELEPELTEVLVPDDEAPLRLVWYLMSALIAALALLQL